MQEAGFDDGQNLNNQLAVCNNAVWALGELAETHTNKEGPISDRFRQQLVDPIA
jgi:hypothetical protein